MALLQAPTLGGWKAAPPYKWDWRAREIEGASIKVHHYFDLVRGQRLLWMFKTMRGSDHLDLAVRSQFLHEFVDQPWIDQRFVALNVDDERELFRIARDFGYPIGSAAVAC